MALNQFIQGSSDDRILESLASGESIVNKEELYKAIDKSKLVQKDVQVQGKNGKVYTRKQWMKASDVKDTGSKSTSTNKTEEKEVKGSKPVDISQFKFKDYINPDGQNVSGRETYRKTMTSVAKETEKTYENVLKTYWGHMPPEDQLRIEFGNINHHISYRDMVEPSAEQGLKDAKQAINDRQKYLIEQAKELTEWDDKQRKWVKPTVAPAPKNSKKTNKTKITVDDLNNAPFDSANVTGSPTKLTIGSAEYTKIGKNKWEHETTSAHAIGGTYTNAEMMNRINNAKGTVKLDIPGEETRIVGDDQSSKPVSNTTGGEIKHSDAASKDYEDDDKNNDYTLKLYDMEGGPITGGIDLPNGVTYVRSQADGKSNRWLKTTPDALLNNGDDSKDIIMTSEEVYKEITRGSYGNLSLKKPSLSQIENYPSDSSDVTGSPTVISVGSRNFYKVGKNKWNEHLNSSHGIGGSYTNSQMNDIISKTNDPVEVDAPKKTKTIGGTQMSKESAKSTTQSITSKVGKSSKDRTDFMNKVESQNITWNKSDNEAVNWMRCLMAMNKHFANGGTFED